MIDVGEVASALATLVEQLAAGRVPDMGGQKVLTLEEMVNAYQRVYDKRYIVRSDDKLVPDRAVGRITWGETFLRQRVHA